MPHYLFARRGISIEGQWALPRQQAAGCSLPFHMMKFIAPGVLYLSTYTCPASPLDMFTDSVRLMGDATMCAVMEFDRNLDPCTSGGCSGVSFGPSCSSQPAYPGRNGPAVWEMADDVRVPWVRVEECSGNYHSLVTGPVDPYGRCSFAYGCCEDLRVMLS